MMEADPSQMANMEAFLNICANGMEIAGMRNGMCFVCASILILFLKKWSVSGKYFGLGIVFLIGGLAAPGLINWLVASARDAHTGGILVAIAVVSGLVALVVVLATFALIIYPMRVAGKRGVEKTSTIMALSCISIIIPVLWPIALFLAHRNSVRTEAEAPGE